VTCSCFASAFEAYSSIAQAQDKACAVRCAILQASAYRSLRHFDGAYKASSAAANTMVRPPVFLLPWTSDPNLFSTKGVYTFTTKGSKGAYTLSTRHMMLTSSADDADRQC
jgi:hypothetical protein